MAKIQPVVIAQIRHSKRKQKVLMKCMGPIDSEVYKPDNTTQDVGVYIMIQSFPTHHYIVVTRISESYIAKGLRFCVVHLITHSTHPQFDNIKVTPDLFDSSKATVPLLNSYITRDRFLINLSDIDMSKSYGEVYLDKLKEVIENY